MHDVLSPLQGLTGRTPGDLVYTFAVTCLNITGWWPRSNTARIDTDMDHFYFKCKCAVIRWNGNECTSVNMGAIGVEPDFERCRIPGRNDAAGLQENRIGRGTGQGHPRRPAEYKGT